MQSNFHAQTFPSKTRLAMEGKGFNSRHGMKSFRKVVWENLQAKNLQGSFEISGRNHHLCTEPFPFPPKTCSQKNLNQAERQTLHKVSYENFHYVTFCAKKDKVRSGQKNFHLKFLPKPSQAFSFLQSSKSSRVATCCRVYTTAARIFVVIVFENLWQDSKLFELISNDIEHCFARHH